MRGRAYALGGVEGVGHAGTVGIALPDRAGADPVRHFRCAVMALSAEKLVHDVVGVGLRACQREPRACEDVGNIIC